MQASDVMVCFKSVNLLLYQSINTSFGSYLWYGFISVPSSCATGDVRLVDGGSEMEGRVEMCRGGVWGAVYDYSGWNYNDVKVICRQLGYPSECEFYVASMSIIPTSPKVFTKSHGNNSGYGIYSNKTHAN